MRVLLLLIMLVAEQASVAPSPNSFHFAASGLMSSYSELSVNLDSGEFILAESHGPGNAPVGKHEGVIDRNQLAGLRETAMLALSSGLRSQACRARDRASRRKGLILIDTPVMDYMPSMSLAMAGRRDSAPIDPGCWSAAADQIWQAAFVAARASIR